MLEAHKCHQRHIPSSVWLSRQLFVLKTVKWCAVFLALHCLAFQHKNNMWQIVALDNAPKKQMVTIKQSTMQLTCSLCEKLASLHTSLFCLKPPGPPPFFFYLWLGVLKQSLVFTKMGCSVAQTCTNSVFCSVHTT